jgi:hypothetical protein
MKRVSTKVVVGAVLLLALLLAGVVSQFADSDPDGLAKVSEDQGFAHKEKTHHRQVFEYGSLSGVIGVLLVLGLAGGVTYAVRRRRPADERA